MSKVIAGYGIKVETDTGHMVWLAEEGTTNRKAKAMKFDSQTGADMYRENLAKANPKATLITEKFTK